MIFSKRILPSPEIGVYKPPHSSESLYIPPQLLDFIGDLPPDSKAVKPCRVEVGRNAFELISGNSATSLSRNALALLQLVFNDESPYVNPEFGQGSIITVEVEKGHPPVDTSKNKFDPRILHRDHLIRHDEFYGAVVIGSPTVYFAGDYVTKKSEVKCHNTHSLANLK